MCVFFLAFKCVICNILEGVHSEVLMFLASLFISNVAFADAFSSNETDAYNSLSNASYALKVPVQTIFSPYAGGTIGAKKMLTPTTAVEGEADFSIVAPIDGEDTDITFGVVPAFVKYLITEDKEGRLAPYLRIPVIFQGPLDDITLGGGAAIGGELFLLPALSLSVEIGADVTISLPQEAIILQKNNESSIDLRMYF